MRRFKSQALSSTTAFASLALLLTLGITVTSPAVLLVDRAAAIRGTALCLDMIAAAAATAAVALALRSAGQASRTTAQRLAATEQARTEMEALFRMTDVLHSATARSDACQVVAATATRLLPRLGGTLHVAGGLGGPVIAAAGEPLEFALRWGRPAPQPGEAVLCLDPACCWALKRQKPHLNNRGPGALRCGHAAGDGVSLELPLIGNGEVFGLLELVAAGPEAEAELRAAEPLALLLAEAATRALTGIALRERLKNDAVRDGLTGLYNRRFLEELQERLALSAERRKSPLSAIMIDIDHFKRINDEHGHAAGDAVLRSVAVAAVSALRRTDLICRYGGEELVVLLPDCPLTHAVERAELLRTRIAELTENGITVTASFGVASIPETSPRSSDLFAAADRAMYQAKQQGRNRVVAAPLRPVAPTISLLASS